MRNIFIATTLALSLGSCSTLQTVQQVATATVPASVVIPTANAFDILKGYDESYFMGEDVDFYWRLQKLCTKPGGHLSFLDDVKVVPSPRRFDHTPTWRTLIWTNPVLIALFRKRGSAWTAWYVKTPR